ncbi:hypothetical protein DJ71_09865 [Halorubrum sp. E3]|uniref:Uncharacterized protein n=4 Tax=Halorubrum distributum TaxID=29283 RepID=M0F3U8_9EURY|nr:MULTISPECIES: hypothetical protein [Halorubrum distributum group]OYR83708.1 hypothetical protein DJ71_09865 [Halorubrum sp. E3]ELZ53867.1 hypothetical protein C465_00659 [Halorubrum distributum JCM 9100]ELZ56014.1 hypothetical protein C466_04189 [Halorubrum distributum JCM 10118]EMA57703.1 hypothetical protein C470_13487 [Halorubrum litoreum JCM 13561]MYL15433.1 hypothetical protein [Halorubrum terrestre]
MDLSESTVRDRARAYAAAEPLYDVERQHVETVAKTFAGDEYGRRDAQWIVRWYFRRYLGEYPDRERREREEAFRDNEFDDVIDAIDGAVDAVGVNSDDSANVAAALDALTALDGVDVAVASGFLQFLAPSRFVAIDRRTWTVLAAAGELDDPYPDPPSAADYRRFDDACRAVTDRTGVDAWTLYRALWRSFEELPAGTS